MYLTEDGHYAIAENSDGYECKESQMKSDQNARQIDEESYSMPDSELKSTHNNKQVFVINSKTCNIKIIFLFSSVLLFRTL